MNILIKAIYILNAIIQGEIWPKPFQQQSTDYFSLVRPSLLQFEVSSCSSSLSWKNIHIPSIACGGNYPQILT